MKKFIIAIAVLAFASPALATQPPKNPPPATGNKQDQTQGQGQIQGQAQGQLQSLRNSIYNAPVTSSTGGVGGNGTGGSTGPVSQTQDVTVNNTGGGSGGGNGSNGPAVQGSQFPVSSATAPSFAIGQCQWALSGGVQAFGFGASAGGAGMYEFCKPLMKAKHFYDIGKPAVAKALECNYSEFKEAYRMAGEPCRNDMTKAEIAAADGQATQALNTAVAPVPVPLAASSNGTYVVGGVVVGKDPVCYDRNNNPVPRGQAGAVRCQ